MLIVVRNTVLWTATWIVDYKTNVHLFGPVSVFQSKLYVYYV